MVKSVTLRLSEDVYEEFREAAAAERRSLANLIETAALARIREAQFVDGIEEVEILSDEALVRRMKAGSRRIHLQKVDMMGDAAVRDDSSEGIPERPPSASPCC